MDAREDPGYETTKLDYVGRFVDPYMLEGLLVLKSDDGREFLMRAFSGESARHIKSFSDNGERCFNNIFHHLRTYVSKRPSRTCQHYETR